MTDDLSILILFNSNIIFNTCVSLQFSSPQPYPFKNNSREPRVAAVCLTETNNFLQFSGFSCFILDTPSRPCNNSLLPVYAVWLMALFPSVYTARKTLLLTRLGLGASPQPNPTVAVSHHFELYILPFTTCYIRNSVAVQKLFKQSGCRFN